VVHIPTALEASSGEHPPAAGHMGCRGTLGRWGKGRRQHRFALNCQSRERCICRIPWGLVMEEGMQQGHKLLEWPLLVVALFLIFHKVLSFGG